MVSETKLGFPEGTVNRFVSTVRSQHINLHSLILMKGDNVFCEKYAPGFDENFRHRLYSVSKSYVSMAIGVCLDEGLLTLDSEIVSYFPDKCPENIHPYIKALTVRDCLMMSTPFNDTPYINTHDDWLKDFFYAVPTHRGGRIFHYDTGASLVLSALVQRVTGKDFNVYLYEKVLRYIGYNEIPECVESPEGTKWGGSGLFCTSRELASFARLLMRNGKTTDGRELISENYVKQATSKQIGNVEYNAHNRLRGYGYGFHIWMTKDGWAMFGLGNQLALCYPKEDILLVCTGDDQGNDFARSYLADDVAELLLKPFGNITEEKPETELQMPVLPGELTSEYTSEISGKTYCMEKNNCGIEKIRFDFENNTGTMTFFARGEEKVIRFGLGHYVEGIFPESHYSGIRINTPSEKGYRCFACAAWDTENILVLKCYAADRYFGHFLLNASFSENGLDLHFTKKAEWFFDEYQGFATSSPAE